MVSDERAVVMPSTGRLLGGRYRLGRRLGRGAVAAVHEAVDVVLGREVAVKLYRPAADPNALYRFGTEARLLAGLSHPGLVTVHDVCLEDDEPYLVVELITGGTVRDLINRGPVKSATAAALGAWLAEVLAYVHARDIVHRDLKPSNMLIDRSGRCYLSDFGMARALSAVHLTVTGEVVGTAAYLAPEQVSEVDPGPPADVYALGLVLLECLTGRTEYTGTTTEVALARLARQPRIPDELPSGWRAVLTAMTARDPADRPDADRCAELLRDVANDPARALVLPSAPGAGRRLPRLRPSHAGLAMLALAGALAVFASAGIGLIPGLPTGEAPPARTEPAGTDGRTGADTGAVHGPPPVKHADVPVPPEQTEDDGGVIAPPATGSAEPKPDESTTDEPMTGEPTTDEPKPDDSTTDKPKPTKPKPGKGDPSQVEPTDPPA